jgi:hypothetical protein
MVAKPDPPFRLPADPQPLGRLVETSFALWHASWRATFPYAVLYGLAGALPALALGELVTRILREALAAIARDAAPWLPLGPAGDPLALLELLWEWLLAPRTWLLFATSALLMFAALALLLQRQAALASGVQDDFARGARAALARLPAGVAAWLIYLALIVLALLPVGALVWFCFRTVLEVDLGGLLALMLVLLAGGLLGSIPAAWFSVAAGFAPVIVALEPTGPWAAQWRSVRRVRGHWVHAALGVTVPLLLYLGLASVVSSLCLGLCLAVAWSLGGTSALFGGAWLGWAQWLGVLPMAAVLPLATSGLVTTWHDLGLRSPNH